MNGEGILAGKLIFIIYAESFTEATCLHWQTPYPPYVGAPCRIPRNSPCVQVCTLAFSKAIKLAHNFNIRDLNSSFNFELDESITSTLWHSDVSYELQPPGLTTFFLLAQPQTGGDTLFTSQVAALKRLSPQYVAFLRTLKAVHSGVAQAEFSRAGRRGGTVRREPVENVHPLVRKHPVTGEEALYVNRQFTRRIVGLKREESGKYTLVV